MGMEAARYKINFKSLFTKWLINMIALFIVVKTIKGLSITTSGTEGFITLLITAAVIGVINAFIKPVVLVLTLPISVLTFGIFTLVLNGVMFALAGLLVPGFEVESLWGAIIGSLLFSLISLICSLFIKSPGGGAGPGRGGTGVQYRVIE